MKSTSNQGVHRLSSATGDVPWAFSEARVHKFGAWTGEFPSFASWSTAAFSIAESAPTLAGKDGISTRWAHARVYDEYVLMNTISRISALKFATVGQNSYIGSLVVYYLTTEITWCVFVQTSCIQCQCDVPPGHSSSSYLFRLTFPNLHYLEYIGRAPSAA